MRTTNSPPDASWRLKEFYGLEASSSDAPDNIISQSATAVAGYPQTNERLIND